MLAEAIILSNSTHIDGDVDEETAKCKASARHLTMRKSWINDSICDDPSKQASKQANFSQKARAAGLCM